MEFVLSKKEIEKYDQIKGDMFKIKRFVLADDTSVIGVMTNIIASSFDNFRCIIFTLSGEDIYLYSTNIKEIKSVRLGKDIRDRFKTIKKDSKKLFEERYNLSKYLIEQNKKLNKLNAKVEKSQMEYKEHLKESLGHIGFNEFADLIEGEIGKIIRGYQVRYGYNTISLNHNNDIMISIDVYSKKHPSPGDFNGYLGLEYDMSYTLYGEDEDHFDFIRSKSNKYGGPSYDSIISRSKDLDKNLNLKDVKLYLDIGSKTVSAMMEIEINISKLVGGQRSDSSKYTKEAASKIISNLRKLLVK